MATQVKAHEVQDTYCNKRFAGFNKEDKQLDAELHRKYIYRGHVASYMKSLMEA